MESEEHGTLDIPPYTATVEKNSRGWTWSVKVRGDDPDALMGRMRQAMAVVRTGIHEWEQLENEDAPVSE